MQMQALDYEIFICVLYMQNEIIVRPSFTICGGKTCLNNMQNAGTQ